MLKTEMEELDRRKKLHVSRGTATKVAVQHPFWGDVSYPHPGVEDAAPPALCGAHVNRALARSQTASKAGQSPSPAIAQ